MNNIFSKLSLLVTATFFIASCSDSKNTDDTTGLAIDNGNYKEYYGDGTLKAIGDTLNGELEGMYKEFYASGNLHYINYYKKGYLHGYIKEFYENGNPKVDMYYVKGKPLGVQYVFFESDSAKVKNKFILSRYKGKEALSTKLEFSILGDTLSDEGRVSVYAGKDTFDLGEKITLHIVLNHAEFEQHRIHIGNFGRDLKLVDSTAYMTFDGKGPQAQLDFATNAKGKKIIRGYIENFKVDTVHPDGSYSTLGTLNNWFDVELFIK